MPQILKCFQQISQIAVNGTKVLSVVKLHFLNLSETDNDLGACVWMPVLMKLFTNGSCINLPDLPGALINHDSGWPDAYALLF